MTKTSRKPIGRDTSELHSLYKKWPDIKRYLRSLGCNSADAEDIFQEALVIFARKRVQPDFELTVDPFHYVKNTCKFLWYNQSRKESKRRTDELSENLTEENDDAWLEKEQQLALVEKALHKLGEKCQQLLQLFYGKGWSMSDIAKKIGLRNDKVAKAQKYRCLTKAKEEVQKLHGDTLISPKA
ncbi:MAG: RNA polymerase sigma factor [Crocinitomicaceae bacterium]